MRSRVCRGCGARFIATSPGPVRYCEPCRSQCCTKCRTRGGQHSATCPRRTARACRGCGATIFPEAGSLAQHQALPGVGGRGVGGDGRALRYCVACRAAQCGTCQRHGGQHAPDCPVGAGRGRVALPYRGVVSEPALLEVYEHKWGVAVRVAATLCGPADAEDVVQDVAFYLWRRRDTLTEISPGFFIDAVKQKAIGRTRYAWRRRAILTDDLVAVERRLVRRATGRAAG